MAYGYPISPVQQQLLAQANPQQQMPQQPMFGGFPISPVQQQVLGQGLVDQSRFEGPQQQGGGGLGGMFGQIQQDPRMMMGLASQLLAASGPTRAPVGFGARLGQALGGFMGDYDSIMQRRAQLKQQDLQNAFQEQQMAMQEQQMRHQVEQTKLLNELQRDNLRLDQEQLKLQRQQGEAKIGLAQQGLKLDQQRAAADDRYRSESLGLARTEAQNTANYQQGRLGLGQQELDLARQMSGRQGSIEVHPLQFGDTELPVPYVRQPDGSISRLDTPYDPFTMGAMAMQASGFGQQPGQGEALAPQQEQGPGLGQRLMGLLDRAPPQAPPGTPRSPAGQMGERVGELSERAGTPLNQALGAVQGWGQNVNQFARGLLGIPEAQPQQQQQQPGQPLPPPTDPDLIGSAIEGRIPPERVEQTIQLITQNLGNLPPEQQQRAMQALDQLRNARSAQETSGRVLNNFFGTVRQ